MSDDDKKRVPALFVEHEETSEGLMETVHGPSCDRTIAAYEAAARGEDPREAAHKHACTGKGPAKVTSKAYRDNYDSIFGSKQPVGQA